MTVHWTSSRHNKFIHQKSNLSSNLYVIYVYFEFLFNTEDDYITDSVILIFSMKNIDVEWWDYQFSQLFQDDSSEIFDFQSINDVYSLWLIIFTFL